MSVFNMEGLVALRHLELGLLRPKLNMFNLVDSVDRAVDSVDFNKIDRTGEKKSKSILSPVCTRPYLATLDHPRSLLIDRKPVFKFRFDLVYIVSIRTYAQPNIL